MCGIAGIYRFGGGEQDLAATLDTMSGAMLHRGPDEGGRHIEPGMRSGLAVRRLSIVDPEHGSQPFFSEDGAVSVVCNGEIYNHRVLRSELEARGYRMRSHADVEVIPHLYREEGIGFLSRLKGMFALALLDRERNRLLLARDAVGMKHLYWTRSGGGLAFASEARALFAAGLVEPEPDWDALGEYFTIGWIQSPRTAFKRIQRLRPGSFLELDASGLRQSQYWVPRFQRPVEHRTLEEQAEELGGLLRGAVDTHLDADVPAGLFLSGGWDSSLVSLYASETSADPLNSYSIHFPDDTAADESDYFRPVARQIGSNSQEVVLRDTDIRDALDATSKALEEPIVTCPTVLGYLLSKTAGAERKFVLGGEGADELFAGYGRFENSPLHRLRHAVPHQLVPKSVPLPLNRKWSRAFRFLAADNDEVAHLHLNSLMMPRQYTPLFSESVPYNPGIDTRSSGVHAETRHSYRDLLDLQLSVEFRSRLADGILLAIDKTAMAHSLEVRMPFLDRDVVDFAHRLPSQHKVQGKSMKRVMAPLAKELPPNVAARGKQGLHVPPRIYQSQVLRDFYAETLLESPVSRELFRRDRLEAWVGKRTANSIERTAELWPLCQFCLWWNHFIGPGRQQ